MPTDASAAGQRITPTIKAAGNSATNISRSIRQSGIPAGISRGFLSPADQESAEGGQHQGRHLRFYHLLLEEYRRQDEDEDRIELVERSGSPRRSMVRATRAAARKLLKRVSPTGWTGRLRTPR